MDNYITGNTIKLLREKENMTQKQLADKLGVSDKTISKWETAKGYPDISMLEPLALSLNISVIELLSGDCIINQNTVGNITRSKFYVCPICSNIIHCMGESVISCCGITLPALESEKCDKEHFINIEVVEDEHFITINHEMTKNHYISFIAYITANKFEMIKLYPEQNAETRFKLRKHGTLYVYCNKHGLMKKKI